MATTSYQPFSPDRNTLLDRCSDVDHVNQVHAHLHKLGLAPKPNQYTTKLVNLYVTLGRCDEDLTRAWTLFDRIKSPDVFTYNTMIKACSSSKRPREALELYNRMVTDQVEINSYTLPYVLSACGVLKEVEQVHTHVLKTGYAAERYAENALIRAYTAFGDLESASWVFERAVGGDVVAGNLMMNGLVKCGQVDEAFRIFESMSEKSVVSWTTMIKGLVEAGLIDEGLELFKEMVREGVRPDKVALAAAVAACGDSGSLARGACVHSYIYRNGIEVDGTLRCVLIDMYAKCGVWEKAEKVFTLVKNDKNVATWTAMIGGFGAHGRALTALRWFYRMQEAGVRPNSITFTAVLTACSHAGLVTKGVNIFKSMELVHGLKPGLEHYGCVVDLMARAGRVDEGLKFIEDMPVEPNAAIWGAMAKACFSYKHFELGLEIARKVIELEPDRAGRYIQLASLYALVGDWDRASAVRREMKRSVLKVPGRSLIDLNGKLIEFLAIPSKKRDMSVHYFR